MKQGLSLVAISLLLLNLTLINNAQARTERLFNAPAAEAPPPSSEMSEPTVVSTDDEEDEDDEGCA